MNIGQIVNPQFLESLTKLNGPDIAAKTAYKLKNITLKAQEEINKYEDIRMQAFKKYGKKNVDGNLELDEHGVVKFDENLKDKFFQEMSELLAVEIDMPSVKLSELDGIKISAKDLIALGDVVAED
jgi:hypothetical protein